MTRRHRPSGQQLNPERVETERVQFWRGGVMMTAMMSRETARELVSNGEAFVISGQAVGELTAEGFSNS